jgi:hypothetical protein
MTTNLKADIRARMTATGEKYTQARRAVLADRTATSTAAAPIERVTVHTTRNGMPLAEADCEAVTKAGSQCRNPFIHGQFWSGGQPEVLLRDAPDTRMLAQRRCRVHVDHDLHTDVLLVMDDHIPSRFSGPHPAPVWQDPRSLELIRTATSGGARAQTLALYLALTERGEDNLAEISERAGLTAADTQASMKVLTELRLVEDGALVG